MQFVHKMIQKQIEHINRAILLLQQSQKLHYDDSELNLERLLLLRKDNPRLLMGGGR